MGFLDGVGSILGKAAAKAQEIQNYKIEYESMSDSELKREYQYLKGKSGQEYKDRFKAVILVLNDRGYGQKQ